MNNRILHTSQLMSYRLNRLVISWVVIVMVITKGVVQADNGLWSLNLAVIDSLLNELPFGSTPSDLHHLDLPKEYLLQLSSTGEPIANITSAPPDLYGINWLSNEELEIAKDPKGKRHLATLSG